MSFLHGDGLPEELPGDPKERIKRAVANNQPHMAMHYMLAIFDQLFDEIEELKSKVDAPAKKASAKKASKKAATKKEPETPDAE